MNLRGGEMPPLKPPKKTLQCMVMHGELGYF